MRLAFVTSHPIQYQAPLFRALAGAVELRVFFGWDGARDDAFDDARGFGRTTAWDVPLKSREHRRSGHFSGFRADCLSIRMDRIDVPHPRSQRSQSESARHP